MNEITPEIYADVFDWLGRSNVRYVVVGSIAVVLHGFVRPIADLDIVIASTPDEVGGAMHALMCAGFVSSVPLPLETLPMMRMFDHLQREIDVFVRYRIPFNELWASAESVRLGGGTVRVMSLEHLLSERRVNNRPRDLLDIEGLLALKYPSDETRITAMRGDKYEFKRKRFS